MLKGSEGNPDNILAIKFVTLEGLCEVFTTGGKKVIARPRPGKGIPVMCDVSAAATTISRDRTTVSSVIKRLCGGFINV